jgi:hypothetical protein
MKYYEAIVVRPIIVANQLQRLSMNIISSLYNVLKSLKI